MNDYNADADFSFFEFDDFDGPEEITESNQADDEFFGDDDFLFFE